MAVTIKRKTRRMGGGLGTKYGEINELLSDLAT